MRKLFYVWLTMEETVSTRAIVLLQGILAIGLFCLPIHSVAQTSGGQTTAVAWMPENTVVLSNEMDARFARDYSILLKHLRIEWIVVDRPVVPEAVQNKNLIVLGRLSASYIGQIILDVMTAQDITTAGATPGEPVVLEKESPWAEDRRMVLCLGDDLITTRNAAEKALRAIIASSPPTSDWIRTTFDAPLDEAARETVERLCYAWDDEELPLQDLTMDVGAKPRARISAAQAADDVERLFHLFSHGYAGYAFFNQDGAFERAKAAILDEIAVQSRWSSQDLSRLFYEQLGFVRDCHTKIGEYRYSKHDDFWYDTELELTLGQAGYQFVSDDIRHTVLSVNGQDPHAYAFPSLNAQGDPIYRLGVLSAEEPEVLQLVVADGEQERCLDVALQRSDFGYYAKKYFREDTLGGVPVIRVRSFSDHHADALEPFVATGSAYKGEPVIVLDVRGNGGGNEDWPIRWIRGLTGKRAEAVFITAELNSKTSTAGRANTFAYMLDLYPDTASYQQGAERFARLAASYEDETVQASWLGPRYPQLPLIPNDTTLIIVTNSLVASSGEGMVMRASQAENVLLVGENTMGCLTLGNAGIFQLPNSRLKVHLPTNFGVYTDLEFREGKGLAPDLWVPAADAVNYAVAAVRSGTIRTQEPLSPAALEQRFVPENARARAQMKKFLPTLIIGLTVLSGIVIAFVNRRKPLQVTLLGGGWSIVGSVWLCMGNIIGLGFVGAGLICLVWGGINLWRSRRSPTADAV